MLTYAQFVTYTHTQDTLLNLLIWNFFFEEDSQIFLLFYEHGKAGPVSCRLQLAAFCQNLIEPAHRFER